MKKLLFLTRMLPDNEAIGGDIPILGFQMKALTNSGYEADLLFLKRNKQDIFKINSVKSNLGFKEIFYADIEPKINLRCVYSWIFKDTSYIFNRFYSKSYSNTILELVKTGNYSTILITTAYLYINIFKNQELLNEIKNRNIKCILGVQVLEHQVLENYIALNNLSILKKLLLKREAKLIKKLELAFINSADKSFFVGQEDLDHIKNYSSKKLSLLHVLPDIQNYKYAEPELEQENSIYFVGAYSWKPNIDAVRYFIKDIFPLILRKNKNIKFYIVGANAPDEIKKLHDGKNIFFVGMVKNVFEEIQKHSLMVAPLRIGGGTRLKIIESIAHGKAIVATSKAFEGVNLDNKKPLLVADTPEIFAEQVLELLSNKQARHNLKFKAREFAEDYYNFEKFKDNFLEIISDS